MGDDTWERKYRALMENSADAVSMMDANGTIVYESPSYTRMMGYDVAARIGKNAFELVHPEDMDMISPLFAELLRGPGLIHFPPVRARRADGAWLWIEGVANNLLAEPSVAALVVNFRDISERKRAEEALRKSEQELKTITDTLPAYVALVGLDDLRYRFVNTAFETGFGKGREEILGMHIRDLIGQGNYEFALPYIEAVRSGKATSYENEFALEAGKRWIRVHYTPGFDGRGKPDSIIVLSLDVTERKEALERITALLREKETILKEVHHRVKNNMGVVMSLLKIQAAGQDDPKITGILQGAIARMDSMSVLYDRLYQSDYTGSVALGNYLPALLREVAAIFPEEARLELRAEVDDAIIDARKVAPLGILVNELITNSMKYAFKGRDSGLISLRAKIAAGRVRLEYRDDGVGLPDEGTLGRSTGFGMQLIRMLAEQLHATLSVERGEGTGYTLEFDA